MWAQARFPLRQPFLNVLTLTWNKRLDSQLFAVSQTPVLQLHSLSQSQQAQSLEQLAPSSNLTWEPREYQKECASAVTSAFERNERPAVSLPTGSGKTVVFCMLLPIVKPRDGQGDKVLIIVPRREIALQTKEKIHQLFPGVYKVGVEMGKMKFDPQVDDVCIGTYQSLSRPDRIEKLDPSQFKLVIVDEAHRTAADSIQTILHHMQVLTPGPAPHLVGFSATMWRNDDRDLRETYNDVVYHQPLTEMIDRGHLCQVRLTNVKGAFGGNLSREQRMMGKNHVLRSEEGVKLIVDLYKDTWPEYKSTVVFCIDIEHMEQVRDWFRASGIDARSVHGRQKSTERDAIISAFSRGEFPVLINCAVLVEGTDIPRIDQVILARSLSSESMAVQMVGRAMRQFPGKKECNIVQFRELSRYDGNTDLVPLLRGLKIEFETEERAPSDSGHRHSNDISLNSEVTRHSLQVSETQFTVEDMFQNSEAYRPETPRQSAFAWVYANKQYYVFTGGKHYLRIAKSKKKNPSGEDSGEWELCTLFRLPERKISVNQLNFSSASLSEVVKTADSMLRRSMPPSALAMLLRQSPWRFLAPTSRQVALLHKWGISEEIIKQHVTRGSASTLINLNRIGYKVRYSLVTSVGAQEAVK